MRGTPVAGRVCGMGPLVLCKATPAILRGVVSQERVKRAVNPLSLWVGNSGGNSDVVGNSDVHVSGSGFGRRGPGAPAP